jgi:hypothetical protein
MIRTRPLEVTQLTLPSGRVLTVPTAEETLRIKGFLIVRRNQTRDYLDVAALADPRPRDASVTTQLDAYRNLATRWTDWGRCDRYAGGWPPGCSKRRCSSWQSLPKYGTLSKVPA